MDTLGTKGKEKASDDGLFTERLEMLFDQCLANLRTFAYREGRPFEEVGVRDGGKIVRGRLSMSSRRLGGVWQSCTAKFSLAVPRPNLLRMMIRSVVRCFLIFEPHSRYRSVVFS